MPEKVSKVNKSGTKSKSEFLPPYFKFNIFAKSCPEIDQPQSAIEESLRTHDITLLFVQHFV